MNVFKIAPLLALLAFAGCGQMHSGQITGKEYDPARTDMVYQSYVNGQTCSGSGDLHRCSTHYSGHLVPVYYPERYVLHLRNGDKKGTIAVDPHTYAEAKIGTKFDDGQGK